jgi:hypothetical protein
MVSGGDVAVWLPGLGDIGGFNYVMHVFTAFPQKTLVCMICFYKMKIKVSMGFGHCRS